jgi:hypothetical protein
MEELTRVLGVSVPTVALGRSVRARERFRMLSAVPGLIAVRLITVDVAWWRA